MRRSISGTPRGSAPTVILLKNFLMSKDKSFKESDKAEIENLMSNFTNTKYDNIDRVGDYMLRIIPKKGKRN